MEHLGQQWRDRANSPISGEDLQRRDRRLPLGAEHREHEIPRDQSEPDADREGYQCDAFGNPQEVPPHGCGVRLYRGKEGRRHLPHQPRDLVHRDVGQGPADVVETEGGPPQDAPGYQEVRVHGAVPAKAGDQDVGTQRCRVPEGVQPRPRQRWVPQPQHGSRRNQRAQHAAAHECPVPKTRCGEHDHADCQDQCLAQVDERERLEAQLPLQQRQRHRLERRDDERRAHCRDDKRQLRSVEEAPQWDRHGAGRDQAGQPQQHRQAVELVDLRHAQLAHGEHRGAQAKLGDQRDQPEVNRGHAHEAVVLRG